MCERKGHDFRPFDERQLYCPRCGEFRVAPAVPSLPTIYPTVYPTWYPWWTQPYPYVYPIVWSSGTTSVSDGNIQVGSTVYGNESGDAVTYTVLS